MRRKKKIKFSLRPKHLLYALLFLCVMLIYLSYQYADWFMPLKTGVGSLVTPMQNGINTIGVYLTEKGQLLESKRSLLEEN